MKQYSDRFAVVVLICLKRNYILHFVLFNFLCLQMYELFILVRSFVILPVTLKYMNIYESSIIKS